MNRIRAISVLIIITLVAISCTDNNVKPYSETYFALGTVCSITLYEKMSDFNFNDAFKIIDDIEDRMSPVITNSELDRINSNAGIQPVQVSADTYSVIKEGIRYAGLKGSKFDISICILHSKDFNPLPLKCLQSLFAYILVSDQCGHFLEITHK